jgi:hypothetical protein
MIDVRHLDSSAPVFGFITGYNTEAPVAQIRACAEYSLPRAIRDYERVVSLTDFCALFKRHQDEISRGAFDMYIQHLLVPSFILIWKGDSEAGLATLRSFCERLRTSYDDKILLEYIRRAEVLRATA